MPPPIELPPPPRAGLYRVNYLDPAWPESGGGKIRRGADRHYDLLKVKDIVRMFETQFGHWAAADAHMYIWTTNNYFPAALECFKVARFRYITTCTWVKDRMGLGQYYRGRTEHCLMGVRGRLPYLIDVTGKRAQGETVLYYPDYDNDLPEPADLPSAFEAPRQRVEGKDKHSRKPPQMRQYIEKVSGGHGLKLECFAQEAAEGWDRWGLEANVA